MAKSERACLPVSGYCLIETGFASDNYTMKAIKEKLEQAFIYPYFIHAGIADAVTTIFALQLGFSELNPLISMLFPTQIGLIPATLVAFAYLRTLSAVWMFKKKKNIRIMLWISLYFPAVFNVFNIVWHYLNLA
ncbi:hypothetical protein DSQ19_01635 [Candidatus Nitrosotenuis sp. DW1]|nr:hypothetical protein DSQ19_01635 [Candidatus Nitrosotenuis sp. DW1]